MFTAQCQAQQGLVHGEQTISNMCRGMSSFTCRKLSTIVLERRHLMLWRHEVPGCSQSMSGKVTEGWAPKYQLRKCINRPRFSLWICYTPSILLQHMVLHSLSSHTAWARTLRKRGLKTRCIPFCSRSHRQINAHIPAQHTRLPQKVTQALLPEAGQTRGAARVDSQRR